MCSALLEHWRWLSKEAPGSPLFAPTLLSLCTFKWHEMRVCHAPWQARRRLHFTEYPECAYMRPKEIGMATGVLEKASSSDVSKRFGFYYDEAMTHPLAVERNGAVRVIMLPAAEYERLARLDHVAMLPSELEPADLRAIRDAEVPASAQELNHLLD